MVLTSMTFYVCNGQFYSTDGRQSQQSHSFSPSDQKKKATPPPPSLSQRRKETTMVEQTVDQNSALKAAKKLLKKEESKSLKVKVLAKNIVEKLGAGNVKTIKKWIVASDKFAVNGKVVTLASKKRLSEAQLETSSKKLKTMDTENKSPVISTMNESTVSEWRKKHKIVVMDARDTEEGKEATKELNTKAEYFPDTSFDMVSRENEIAPVLLKQCTEGNGFKSPTPIQAQCWPVLLHTLNGKKRDVVGIAETGSGKTLAFALPALSAMFFEGTSKRRLPRMLILAPTRELAMQSHEVLVEYGAVVDLKSLVIYGGVPKYTQTAELRKDTVDCIVATPGRIKDLINDGSCDLSHVSHLVLDEADRMLDMGFEEDVRFIISQCKAKEDGRQTAMFSATWPAAIQQGALFAFHLILIEASACILTWTSYLSYQDCHGVHDGSCSNLRWIRSHCR